MFTIQPFTPTDAKYERIVAIQKRIYPDVPITVPAQSTTIKRTTRNISANGW